MSDVFNPKHAGALNPDVRDATLWEGKEVAWPPLNPEIALPRVGLEEVSFSGLGGLLFEVGHAAIELDTSTASYYMEARRVTEGYPAFLGQRALEGYRFLIADNVGFAVEREDASTGQLIDMRGQFIYDRFVVRKKATIFQPEGMGTEFSRSLKTGRVQAIRQVPVREKPLLRRSAGRRKLFRGS